MLSGYGGDFVANLPKVSLHVCDEVFTELFNLPAEAPLFANPEDDVGVRKWIICILAADVRQSIRPSRFGQRHLIYGGEINFVAIARPHDHGCECWMPVRLVVPTSNRQTLTRG